MNCLQLSWLFFCSCSIHFMMWFGIITVFFFSHSSHRINVLSRVKRCKRLRIMQSEGKKMLCLLYEKNYLINSEANVIEFLFSPRTNFKIVYRLNGEWLMLCLQINRTRPLGLTVMFIFNFGVSQVPADVYGKRHSEIWKKVQQ